MAGRDSEVRDLARPLPDGAQHRDHHRQERRAGALKLIRHDAAHVLAAAVMELYPGVKISIGPRDRGRLLLRLRVPRRHGVSEADFPAIEERMREHVKAAEAFEREDVPSPQARERFLARARTTRSS